MLKRCVAAIAWRVGTGLSTETRLNEQAASSNSSWTASGKEAFAVERDVQAGDLSAGRPFLNPA